MKGRAWCAMGENAALAEIPTKPASRRGIARAGTIRRNSRSQHASEKGDCNGMAASEINL
eukprot:795446-Rhodomonas_salina.2